MAFFFPGKENWPLPYQAYIVKETQLRLYTSTIKEVWIYPLLGGLGHAGLIDEEFIRPLIPRSSRC